MTNHTSHETRFHKRHFKPFWPITIIALLSFLVGALVVWTLYKQGLEDDLYSLFPSANIAQKHKVSEANEKLKALLDLSKWKTYSSKDYGFSILYPENTKILIADSQDYEDNNVGDKGVGYICKFDQQSGTWAKVSGKGASLCPSEVKISTEKIPGHKAYMNEGATRGKNNVINSYVTLDGGKKFLVLSHAYALIPEDPKAVQQPEIVLTMLSGFKLIKTPALKLIQACPDQLIDDRTSLSGDYHMYYIYQEARVEISEFDAAWVKKNCSIKKLVVY